MKHLNYFKLHLIELNFFFSLLIFSFFFNFLICFYYSNQLIFLFLKKFIYLNLIKYLIFTHITEILLTKIKICSYLNFIFFFNISIIQFWFFLYKGLYKHENIQILKKFIFYKIFTIFSLYLIINLIIPNIWYFFIKNNLLNNLNLFFEPKFEDFFSFYFFSFIIVYLLFNYCLFIYYLFFYKINKTKIRILIKYRKYFYLKFLLFSIFFSLPDFFSQFFFFFFFLVIFETLILFSIFKIKYLYKN